MVDDEYDFLAGTARHIKDRRVQGQITHTIEKLFRQVVLRFDQPWLLILTP